jgi:L-malate glycosyltransferase
MSRIAVLSPYAAPIYGGISTFVSGLAKHLQHHGHSVSVLAGLGAGDTSLHSDLGTGASYARRAGNLLKSIAPDVVHCNAHKAMLAVGVRYRRAHPETRLVFSFHTTPRIRAGSQLRRLLGGAEVVTFVSRNQMEKLRAKLRLQGDLRLFRPAVEIPSIDKGAAREWTRARGIRTTFPTLTFVGPLEYPRKVEGVLDLVASLPRVRARFPSSQLLIVGDGTRRPRIAQAAKTLGVPVTITGFVDRPEFILAVTDLYCHISYEEGLPLALLEAMAAGCAVIASGAGGIPEVLDGRNGLLVKPGPEAIADAILRLASDTGMREAMGQAAAETIRTSFTWEARTAELYAVYGIGG